MPENRGNLLIGRGEQLLTDSVWAGGGGSKPEPYSLAQQRAVLHSSLISLAERARESNPQLAPRGEIAAKFMVHPEFLAKSYFPTGLLRNTGLRLLGSRAATIEPRQMVHGRPVRPGVTAVLIVAGTADNFLAADSLLMSSARELGPRHVEFRRLESIDPFGPSDKLRINSAHFDGWAEISLHAGLQDDDVRTAFAEAVRSAGGLIDESRMRIVGGLTFAPIYLPLDRSQSALRFLEDFTHLRVVRNMPLISAGPSDTATRNASFPSPPLPSGPAVDESIRAVIFDGGFPHGALPWVSAIDAPGVPPDATDLPHGAHVTSAFLFGRINGDEESLPLPFCNVDHVRVLPSRANDLRVMDVIDRIIDQLKNARDAERPYQFANLSLGPRLPILDDDPHEWTVRLDDLLSLGDLFMTVAAGNDGAHGPELGRIQPPADAVNAFTVGSANKRGDGAMRASYSCLGPGRSPGLVKPDALAFGGDLSEPLQLYSPISSMLVHQTGTSFAAPLVLRLAAGLQANISEDLQPIMLHSLLVSRASFNPRRHEQMTVGWGMLPEDIEHLLYSPSDEVVVMYQGHVLPGQPIRAPIPLPPDIISEGKVQISATFAYRAPIDPAHPVNYTRAGLEIRFQPDGIASKAFFSKNNFDTEQELRADALKWETCRHRSRKIARNSLTDPSFVIRYQGREDGQPERPNVVPHSAPDGRRLLPSERIDALPFALVVRLRVPDQQDLAAQVLASFPVLAEVPLRVQTGIQTG